MNSLIRHTQFRTTLPIHLLLLSTACQLMAYLNNFTLSTFVPLIKDHFQRQVAHYIRYGTQDCDWRNQHAVCLCLRPHSVALDAVQK